MGRHKKQKQSNFIWFIIFIAFCILLYLILKDRINFPSTSTTTSSTTTTIIKSLEFETKTIKDEQNIYTINASYPYFNISFIDESIKKFIDESIIDFKNNFLNNQDSYHQYSLDIIFEPYLVSNQLVSIRFISSIYTGGAHGNQEITTKNFNLLTKQEIKLNSLFKNDEYIKYISDKAIDYFLNKNISNNIWLEEGAGPKYSNFENFTYSSTKTSLIFHFSPYQIAPYSEGVLTFEIPISDLSKFMK